MISSLTMNHGQVVIHCINSIEAIECLGGTGEALVVLHSGYEEYELARFYKPNENYLRPCALKVERIKSLEYPLHWAVEFIGYLEENMAQLEYRGRFLFDQVLERFIYDHEKMLENCGISVRAGD